MFRFVPVLCCLIVPMHSGFAADDPPGTSEDDAVSIKVVGTLQTGIVAIGGETTGVVVKSKGIAWELEFGKNAELKQTAAKLNGKKVVVEGSLERRGGVEIKERWIVTVTKLQPRRE
jgi:hypothetical protein